MNVIKTALPDLAAALRPHGVHMTYAQLFARASSGMFPVRREARLVFAIGDPATIAKLILDAEAKKNPCHRTAA